jgi:hypothetical protein
MCAQDVLLKNLYIESLFHKRKKIDKGKRFESWDFQQLSAMAGMHVCMYVCMYICYEFISCRIYVCIYVCTVQSDRDRVAISSSSFLTTYISKDVPQASWRNISHHLNRRSVDCRHRFVLIMLGRDLTRVSDVWFEGEVWYACVYYVCMHVMYVCMISLFFVFPFYISSL